MTPLRRAHRSLWCRSQRHPTSVCLPLLLLLLLCLLLRLHTLLLLLHHDLLLLLRRHGRVHREALHSSKVGMLAARRGHVTAVGIALIRVLKGHWQRH